MRVPGAIASARPVRNFRAEGKTPSTVTSRAIAPLTGFLPLAALSTQLSQSEVWAAFEIDGERPTAVVGIPVFRKITPLPPCTPIFAVSATRRPSIAPRVELVPNGRSGFPRRRAIAAVVFPTCGCCMCCPECSRNLRALSIRDRGATRLPWLVAFARIRPQGRRPGVRDSCRLTDRDRRRDAPQCRIFRAH